MEIKKRPAEWGRKISAAKMGHSVSEESRRKMSLARKGISHPWTGKRRIFPKCPTCEKVLSDMRAITCKKHQDFSNRFGRIPGNKGAHYKLNLSPEERERRSEQAKNQKWTEERRIKMRKFRVENPLVSRQKFKDTSIELAIEAKLKELNIPFLKQFSLHGISRVDFYLPESNIAIQCDGCFWHNCKIHYPKYHQAQFEKDRKKDLLLTEKGVKIYRFWEHEIKQSAEDCVKKVLV